MRSRLWGTSGKLILCQCHIPLRHGNKPMMRGSKQTAEPAMAQPSLISHHLDPLRAARRDRASPEGRTVRQECGRPRRQARLVHRQQFALLGKVPLLQVARPDGPLAVLFESAGVSEFIEETQPGPRLHPEDPLERAQHRGWMEFGSSILADIWGLETTPHGEMFAAKRAALAAKFGRVEAALGQGPWFAGRHFSLVDAVFAPIFRYFDLFDVLVDTGVFATTPKVRAWRAMLAQRASVQQAVGADYQDRLRAFLARHDAHLLQLAA